MENVHITFSIFSRFAMDSKKAAIKIDIIYTPPAHWTYIKRSIVWSIYGLISGASVQRYIHGSSKHLGWSVFQNIWLSFVNYCLKTPYLTCFRGPWICLCFWNQSIFAKITNQKIGQIFRVFLSSYFLSILLNFTCSKLKTEASEKKNVKYVQSYQ